MYEHKTSLFTTGLTVLLADLSLWDYTILWRQ